MIFATGPCKFLDVNILISEVLTGVCYCDALYFVSESKRQNTRPSCGKGHAGKC